MCEFKQDKIFNFSGMSSSDGSFWRNNLCVPSWSERVKGWWNEEPIRLLRTTPGYSITATPVLGYTLRRGRKDDALPLTEFWGRYYSASRRCMCAVPLKHIQDNIEKNIWEVYVVIQNQTGVLVGSIVRRWLQSPLYVKGKVFQKAAIVDYFCTAPGVRKRGVGRWLLATLQNTGPVPLPPHLILWEGLQVSIPPTVAALYWNRRVVPKGQERGTVTQLQGEQAREVWNKLVKGRDIFTTWSQTSQPSEVSVWRTEKGDVVLWNTFHWSLPESHCIGVVMAATSGAAVNTCVEAKGIPFGILVAPGEFAEGDSWAFDSHFQWMTYNLQTPFCSSKYPLLCL
jgi:hypothetical protein